MSKELGLKFNYIYDEYVSLYQQAFTVEIEMISATKTTVEYNNHTITHINAAIGYAIRCDTNSTIEETLVKADEQMYHNKAISKNQRMTML